MFISKGLAINPFVPLQIEINLFLSSKKSSIASLDDSRQTARKKLFLEQQINWHYQKQIKSH
jgi:hypothetical protein